MRTPTHKKFCDTHHAKHTNKPRNSPFFPTHHHYYQQNPLLPAMTHLSCVCQHQVPPHIISLSHPPSRLPMTNDPSNSCPGANATPGTHPPIVLLTKNVGPSPEQAQAQPHSYLEKSNGCAFTPLIQIVLMYSPLQPTNGVQPPIPSKEKYLALSIPPSHTNTSTSIMDASCTPKHSQPAPLQ